MLKLKKNNSGAKGLIQHPPEPNTATPKNEKCFPPKYCHNELLLHSVQTPTSTITLATTTVKYGKAIKMEAMCLVFYLSIWVLLGPTQLHTHSSVPLLQQPTNLKLSHLNELGLKQPQLSLSPLQSMSTYPGSCWLPELPVVPGLTVLSALSQPKILQLQLFYL